MKKALALHFLAAAFPRLIAAGPAGELLKESSLDEILMVAGLTARPGTAAEKDQLQETTCAANAAYLALALAGNPEPLRDIVCALGVSAPTPETSLEAIRQFLRETGISCAAVRGGTEVLGMVRSGFAILHATRPQNLPGGGVEVTGHYLVVDDYDPVTGTLRVYDPPALPYRSLAGDVLKPWTGHALLFGDSAWALSRRNAGLTATAVGLLAGSVLCFLASVWNLRRKSSGALQELQFIFPGWLDGG